MLGSAKQKLDYLRGMQKQFKNHIVDEYIAGFYNGLESAIAVFEGREPEHILYEEKQLKGEGQEQEQKRVLKKGKLKKG